MKNKKDVSSVVSLDKKRAEKQRAEFADAVAESLGVTTQGLAEMVDAPVDSIREGFIEAVERQSMYHAFDEKKKELERKQGLDPDTCYNGACDRYQQYEHSDTEVSADSPELEYYVFSGRKNFCKEGRAQSCIFRLLEYPYSDPFVDIPSHNECVRILQRIGYIRGGSFEEELGTNFMVRMNTRKLWEAYVLLLVETGRVVIPEEDWDNVKHHEEKHAKFVGGQELAHEYFRDRELPDNVATVAELVAQRNALLAFIRGELDWPDGRCPCGEDEHWNGVAHTEKCRLRPRKFHHVGTETGRFSSSKPNISQPPGWVETCCNCSTEYNVASHKKCPICGTEHLDNKKEKEDAND